MERRISSANDSQVESRTSWTSLDRGRLEVGGRGGAAAEADGQAQQVGLLMFEAAILHERLDERLVAQVDDARELRRAAGRDDDVADAGADVDERAGSVGLGRSLVDERHRRSHRAHERERLKVDAVDGEAGLPGDLHELIDHVALGGDDEHLLPSAALAFARRRRQDLEVQDGLVERDGDGLLRLELDGGAQLLGIDDGELHGAHDDLLVGDADGEPLAGEAGRLPEGLELGRETVDVDDLAFEHQTVGKRPRGDRR